MQPYEQLEAWVAAHRLAVAVFSETEHWPAAERYGLTAQVRRAAFSIPANIVEGRARFGRKEFRRFLDISWGSLAEVDYTLRLALDLGLLPKERYLSLIELRDRTARPLFGLLRSMGAP